MKPFSLYAAVCGAPVRTRDLKKTGQVIAVCMELPPEFRVIVRFKGCHTVSQYGIDGRYWWTYSETKKDENPDDLTIAV
jgi:hypothetical protein